jgi:hypothetical protein
MPHFAWPEESTIIWRPDDKAARSLGLIDQIFANRCGGRSQGGTARIASGDKLLSHAEKYKIGMGTATAEPSNCRS